MNKSLASFLAAVSSGQTLLDPTIDFCASDIDQSPINVPFSGVTVDSLITNDLSCTFPATLEGNPVYTGETVRFNVDSVSTNSTCTFQGATYALDQFHFHWGRDDDEGSEHTLDGTQYPLEMHLVHVNTKYADASEAVQFDDGFLVLAILYEVNSCEDGNAVIDTVVSNVGEEEVEGPFLTLTTADLTALQSSSVEQEFCTLEGSLTTPPCTPNVRWVLAQNLGEVSKQTMFKFRSLLVNEHSATTSDDTDSDDDDDDEDDDDVCDDDEFDFSYTSEEGGRNFREVQGLNGRTITCARAF